MDCDKIISLFDGMIDAINFMLKKDLYEEKDIIKQIKGKTQKWLNLFRKDKTLTSIDLDDIIFLDEEVIELLDRYVTIESYYENYVERLHYNFTLLEKMWKDEMLGGNKNV